MRSGSFFVAILMACTTFASAQSIRVGESIPELVLPRLSDGEPSSLGAFRGRKVLLLVYASW